MKKKFVIDGEWLTLDKLQGVMAGEVVVELSESTKEKVTACRKFLDQKVVQSKTPIYGVNTGFGSLCDTKVSSEELEELQRNIVMSHACGTGEKVPVEIVRLMLVLKIQGLSYGKSGVQLVTLQRLVDLYNRDILPVVYQQGSLGASGDLSPLAHLALPLLGMGEVVVNGKEVAMAEVMGELNWRPIVLQSKEGLALLNGTQFMSAYASYVLISMHRLSVMADRIAAVSIDAYDGRIEPFYDQLHTIRRHNGQFITARNIQKCLEGSEIISQTKEHVQDPYSFRCVPQVHGACKDAIAHAQHVIEQELNSVTDNPTVFPEDDRVLSGGNFHGQPLAMVMDYLALAIAELGSISERRTYKLIAGERGLPAFLIDNPGLNSGFMIPQYTAASIVSQNKQLASPASIDTIDSSNGQEDHVSMGANAATRLYRMEQNLSQILGIELFNAVQAIEYRQPLNTSQQNQQLIESYRKVVPRITQDVIMYTFMQKSKKFVKNFLSSKSILDLI